MNGLSIVAGVGPRVTINGREFQIRGKTNAYYADVEAAIKKLRGNPLDMLVDASRRYDLSKEPVLLNSMATMVSEKFRNWNMATYMDYLEFNQTPDGEALMVWHAIKDDAKDVTLEQVRYWLLMTRFHGTEAGRAVIKEVSLGIAVASGEDQLGNSSGQPGQTAETQTVPSTGS